jgi:hypothetical protein
MSLEQQLLVCESTLARLEATLTTVAAEIQRGATFGKQLCSVLAHLEAEQHRLAGETRAILAKVQLAPLRAESPLPETILAA